MARFDLSDEEWAVISPLLPKQGRGPERRTTARSSMASSIFCAPGRHGATCRGAMGLERRSTIAMFDWGGAVFGRWCLMRWPGKVRIA